MGSFWEHLEVLRGCLLRVLVVTLLAGVVAFCLKEPLFQLVLAPGQAHFFVYRWMGVEGFTLPLINTGLAEQMMIHLKVALVAGLIAASPYVLYVLFGFVSPALYPHEQRYATRLLVASYAMFFLGMAVCYLLLFPLTVHFLGTYQVSSEVQNMVSITSYVDTLLMMLLLFGLIFQLPVLAWLMGRFGLLRASWMQRYRRHAIVVILTLTAIITPTADMLSLLIVSFPVWMLYELSVLLVRFTERQQ